MSVFSSNWVGRLARTLLSGSFSHGLRVAQSFLDGTVRNLVDRVVDRLKRTALDYAAAAAFALAALVSLSAALAEGLKALGLPGWAAHLLLGIVWGGLAWVFYSRPPSGESEEFTSGNDPDEEPRERSGGVSIRIVNGARRPPARARKAAPRPRPKKRRRVVTVRAKGRRWEVTAGRSRSVRRVYATRRGALRAARAIARKTSARLVVREVVRLKSAA